VRAETAALRPQRKRLFFLFGILFASKYVFFNSWPTQKVIQRTKVFWWPVCIFACEILAIFRWQPAGKLARVEFQALRRRRRRNSLALQSGIRR
jgi:predicted alpha-1,6-mannanase (GH76 family)